MFVDSHCHIDFPDFEGGHDALLARMAAAQVTHALCVSVTMPEYPRVLALAKRYDNIFASCGVHPDYVPTDDPNFEPSVDDLIQLSNDPKVVAIGETGLDYFRLKGDLDWQRERFRTHIRAAIETKKPLIIHTRAASSDTIRIMQEEGARDARGVMHCFTEDWACAKAALDMNFMISFSGIATFKTASDLREVAKQVPDDRLLIETDSPYLAPVPLRGKTNEPSYVPHVAACLAKERGHSIEQLAAYTSTNFFNLFNCL